MRLTLFFLLVSVFSLMAENVHSQTSKVTLNREDTRLLSILNDIETQTDYLFIYKDNINVDARHSINAEDASLTDVLQELLSQSNIDYKVEGNHIILTRKEVQQQRPEQRTVSGVVHDANGEVMIGVTIALKGNPGVGTITNVDGGFTLPVATGDVLVFSYIGYTTQEVRIGDSSRNLNVRMQEDSELLDEVVVVGFGTQKKVNLTGSVSVATSEDIENRPVANAVQALQGMVPGLYISSTTGELDANATIQIRGLGTIGKDANGNAFAEASPLILIDGMEGDLSTINPEDIETVSVLKDASSSSIYGSRAAYGVILVTTKKGSVGRTSIQYSNNLRWNSPINMPEMLDSYSFSVYYNDASFNNGGGRIFSEETQRKMLDFQAAGGSNRGGLPDNGSVWGKPAGDPYVTAWANTDWYKETYKSNVFSQTHNFTLNGGSDRMTYYASFAYMGQEGQLRHGHDKMDRYNVMTRINAQVLSWLRFNYTLRFSRTDNERPTMFNNGLYDIVGRQTWPNLPAYDENGYYFDNNAATPAMRLALGGVRNQQSDRVSQQAALLIEPIKNWVTHVEFNYLTNTQNVRSSNLPLYNHDVAGNVINTNGTSSVTVNNRKNNYLNLQFFSEYSHTFNMMHNMKVMAGFQAEENKEQYLQATGYGLYVDDMRELDLVSNVAGTTARAPEVQGNEQQWATAGFFGRANYDYDGKYLAEFSYRYDGSSRFRRGSRWVGAPSFSAGWNVARENFWKSLAGTVNQLKLRFSYGELSNQATRSLYPTYRVINISPSGGDWLQGGLKPTTSTVGALISTALTWETVNSWNVGVDFGLLKNRLTGSFEVYRRSTKNMVGQPPRLPEVLGYDPPVANNADMHTDGWELVLSWRDRLKNGLGYSAAFTLSDARNYIDRYTNTINSLGDYIVGRPIGDIWGYETVGIAQTKEEMDAHLAKVGGQTNLGTNWDAGDIMYADLDGKPGINNGSNTLDDHGDLKVLGNNTPRFQFSLNLSADYKGFDLRLFFQGVMKRDIWNGTYIFFGASGNQWWSAGYKEHVDYWRGEPSGLEGHQLPANTDAYYARPTFGSGKNQQTQSRFLQDASYIRLKNLQVGYTIPRDITRRFLVNNLRVYVSAENLWTGTGLSKVFDPETVMGGYSSGGNYYGNAYPLSRTLSFGLSLTL
ncbi:MAG: TonB-dependent receptor [Prevotellaceae bacterium]|jgi:TonB-linked SusC/RagA family outer membrane protein|nr:TonB-dependent receptor [Prevotellaceae bacterium]